jgi:NhaP-type Na+/H+ or K+/H+ antiporter
VTDNPIDWGYMFLNYLAVNVARFVVVFLFLPLISRMGNGVTWQEAIFMSWGGLRGAVGLALAMSVALNEKFHGTGVLGLLWIARALSL